MFEQILKECCSLQFAIFLYLRHNIQDQHKHNTPESKCTYFSSRVAVWEMKLKGKDKDAD